MSKWNRIALILGWIFIIISLALLLKMNKMVDDLESLYQKEAELTSELEESQK